MSFPIACTACNKTFTISDEIFEKKVAGRVVTIKCKSCGQGIRVDGTKGGGATTAAAPSAAPAPAIAPTPSAAPDPAAAAPAPAATPAAAPAEPLWAVDYPDGQDREFTTAEVIAELERGAIERTTLVWRDGMEEWLELHQVTELAVELAKIEAKKRAIAVAAAAAANKAGPVHKPRAPMPTVTGLAGLPGAGAAMKPFAQQQPPSPLAQQQPPSPVLPKPPAQQPASAELPKPRAALGSSPELLKPRAALGSSPELFKPRAALRSSPSLPKPAAPPAAVPPPPPPPAPLAVAAAPPAPAPTPPLPIPAAAPPPVLPPPDPLPDFTPPLPASVARVVSRPPQVPTFPASPAPVTPFATGPAAASDHASVEWPQAKSKTPLIIGGAVAAVVLIGVGVLALGGKEAPPPPAPPISAAPASPAATPTSTPTTAEAAPSQPGSDTASGSDPVATAPDPGATPGAGFAELFAAGARKAESKGSTVAPAARFEAAATKAPLAEAATQAQACKQSGGPTGKVTVVVTFDPSGKVSSATIADAPFAGTATGACISQALKRAVIPPFSGLPGTVSKTFSVL